MADGPPLLAVYTDGACLGNPGPGGWAWAVPDGAFASGAAEHTTNQRMEIEAALEAVRANASADQRLEVVSDSTYVVNCFRDRWWEGWLKRGWLNSQKKPVANRDLWEPFIELVRERGNVTFRWVKGHAGDPMNDLVDRLAVEAADLQEGRTGFGVPADLGDADDLKKRRRKPSGSSEAPSTSGTGNTSASSGGGPAAVDGKTIDGRGIVVFGHRPTELGGYDDNPIARSVRSRLADILRAKADMHDDVVAVTGLRLGAEILGAQAALDAGVPYVVVLPYPDPEKVWPESSQRVFRDLVDQAADTILLQRAVPDSKQKAGNALRRRDAWLARNASEAILVWDGKDELLRRLHRSLEDHLGDDVWVVDPGELQP